MFRHKWYLDKGVYFKYETSFTQGGSSTASKCHLDKTFYLHLSSKNIESDIWAKSRGVRTLNDTSSKVQNGIEIENVNFFL